MSRTTITKPCRDGYGQPTWISHPQTGGPGDRTDQAGSTPAPSTTTQYRAGFLHRRHGSIGHFHSAKPIDIEANSRAEAYEILWGLQDDDGWEIINVDFKVVC